MATEEELYRFVNNLDWCILDAETSLDKCRLISDDLNDFFDHRENVCSSEETLRAVVHEFKHAAIRYDIVADYLIQLQRNINGMRDLLISFTAQREETT